MEKVTHNKGTMFLIGERLKSCRKAAGLSQEQLIDIIEALPDNMGKERNVKQISYLENGTRQLSPEYASLLAQALNVRVEYLLLKDDFRTEIEKLTDTLAGMNGIYNHILSLAALHGYETLDIDFSGSNEFIKMLYSENAVKVTKKDGTSAIIPHKQWRDIICEIDRFVEFKLSGLPFVEERKQWPTSKNVVTKPGN